MGGRVLWRVENFFSNTVHLLQVSRFGVDVTINFRINRSQFRVGWGVGTGPGPGLRTRKSMHMYFRTQT